MKARVSLGTMMELVSYVPFAGADLSQPLTLIAPGGLVPVEADAEIPNDRVELDVEGLTFRYFLEYPTMASLIEVFVREQGREP